MMPTRIAAALLAAALFPSVAGAQRGAVATLSFKNTEFIHRWSQATQHEFTPKGDEDLTKWNTMVTLNVHEAAKTGDQLAEVANSVLANYQKAGKILRTDSKPRTEKSEAEHLIAAVLGTPQFLEVVFARILLHEGRGTIVVFSKRVYGAKAGNEMSAWLEKNGPDTEEALMQWRGIPTQAWMKALPQTK